MNQFRIKPFVTHVQGKKNYEEVSQISRNRLMLSYIHTFNVIMTLVESTEWNWNTWFLRK